MQTCRYTSIQSSALDAEKVHFIPRPFYAWTKSSILGGLQGRYGSLPQTILRSRSLVIILVPVRYVAYSKYILFAVVYVTILESVCCFPLRLAFCAEMLPAITVLVKLNPELPWQKLHSTRRRIFLPEQWT